MDVSLGRIVHFVEEGSIESAAIVTDVHQNGTVDLILFRKYPAHMLSPMQDVPHDEQKSKSSWHWPERAPEPETKPEPEPEVVFQGVAPAADDTPGQTFEVTAQQSPEPAELHVPIIIDEDAAPAAADSAPATVLSPSGIDSAERVGTPGGTPAEQTEN